MDRAERLFSIQRARDGLPSGQFDLPHLQSIHHHLFQDVYEWAGEVRQVDFHKGGRWFHPCDRINIAMDDVHKRLTDQDHLKQQSPEGFSNGAGVIIGDINLVHPFREGNGRTQLQYLKQLGAQVGHDIDIRAFEGENWIDASIEANKANYEPMQECIHKSITPPIREKEQMQGDALKAKEYLPEAAYATGIEIEEHGIAPAQEEIQEPGIATDAGLEKGMER